MAIAPIPSYPMPHYEKVCKNIAGWRPDPGRAALLVHDMQRYFIDAFTATESPARELLGNVRALLALARRSGVPVGYTMQRGDMTEEERGLLRDYWGMGMSSEASQRGFVTAVEPEPQDSLIVKWRYSAFHRTRLLEFLRANSRDQLIICGVYAHLGCLVTAYDSFGHDIETFLVADAVADFTAAGHTMALANAAESCAVVLNTAEVATQMSSCPPRVAA